MAASSTRLAKLQSTATELQFNSELRRVFQSQKSVPSSGLLRLLAPPPESVVDAVSSHHVNATPEAIVVDPGFDPSDPRQGHHFNLNVFYRDLLNELGLRTAFYGKLVPGREVSTTDFYFRPAFTSRLYPSKSIILTDLFLANANTYFQYELDTHVPKTAEAYIFHTVRNTTILGLASWIFSKLEGKDVCIVIGVIDNKLGVDSASEAAIFDTYRKAIALLKKLKSVALIIYCETQAHVDILRELGADTLEVVVFRYVAASLAVQHVADWLEHANQRGNITLGYVGGTREERGADLIPRIALETMAYSEFEVRWITQINREALRRISGSKTDLATFEKDPRIEIIEGTLSTREYYKLLARIDIVVLPYRERYAVTGSGVFIEALSLAKVLVIPNEGWMVETLRMCGGEASTFEIAEPDAIIAATRTAVRNFDRMKASAIKAAAVWNNYQSGGAQLQSWLGSRISSSEECRD